MAPTDFLNKDESHPHFIDYGIVVAGADADVTGCGNTLDIGRPAVLRLTLDSLRYWVREMGVDGFRFDLASILSRDQDGRLMPNPPLVDAIAEENVVLDEVIVYLQIFILCIPYQSIPEVEGVVHCFACCAFRFELYLLFV